MGLLVIQTLDQVLPEPALAKLRRIVGEFTFVHPMIDGETISKHAWAWLDQCPTFYDEQAEAAKVDAIIAKCDISDADWEENEILIIFTHWSYAGIQLWQGAILDAISRRKGGMVKHISFQDNNYDDKAPFEWTAKSLSPA